MEQGKKDGVDDQLSDTEWESVPERIEPKPWLDGLNLEQIPSKPALFNYLDHGHWKTEIFSLHLFGSSLKKMQNGGIKSSMGKKLE